MGFSKSLILKQKDNGGVEARLWLFILIFFSIQCSSLSIRIKEYCQTFDAFKEGLDSSEKG